MHRADTIPHPRDLGEFTADENSEFHAPYNPTDKNEICTSGATTTSITSRRTWRTARGSTRCQNGGLHLDAGTAGYTVAHNVPVNAMNAISQNRTGTNTLTDDIGVSPATIAAAGIEAAYADIKTMTIPAQTF